MLCRKETLCESEKMTKSCSQCKATDSLVNIVSRACDGNYIVFPNGREIQGYLPNINGLCESDGLTVEICMACGQLNGLDRSVLKEQLSQLYRDNK